MALLHTKVTSHFLELSDWDTVSVGCELPGGGEAAPPLPAWSLSPLWAFHEKSLFVNTSTETPGSLDLRRVHPAASTSLLLSWNITVLHSQIKVNSISLLRCVKLGLITSWMQQSGVAVVMSAGVLGSIQLGIVFFPLFLVKGGSQDECLTNFWNMYLYKSTIKAE